ncbi:MAG: hypothetical protein K940chlam3_00331 [Chlamydiae bacterium]|nr:hypothetical protein [Chlamydiota bacterium]
MRNLILILFSIIAIGSPIVASANQNSLDFTPRTVTNVLVEIEPFSCEDCDHPDFVFIVFDDKTVWGWSPNSYPFEEPEVINVGDVLQADRRDIDEPINIVFKHLDPSHYDQEDCTLQQVGKLAKSPLTIEKIFTLKPIDPVENFGDNFFKFRDKNDYFFQLSDGQIYKIWAVDGMGSWNVGDALWPISVNLNDSPVFYFYSESYFAVASLETKEARRIFILENEIFHINHFDVETQSLYLAGDECEWKLFPTDAQTVANWNLENPVIVSITHFTIEVNEDMDQDYDFLRFLYRHQFSSELDDAPIKHWDLRQSHLMNSETGEVVYMWSWKSTPKE